MALTTTRLTVEQVAGLLTALECAPDIRKLSELFRVEDLCRDWMEMRAAQADPPTWEQETMRISRECGGGSQ